MKSSRTSITVKRVRAAVEAALQEHPTLVNAWGVTEVEQRGKAMVFHMPVAPLFDHLYEVIDLKCNELKLPHKRAEKWYTAAELDDVLGDVRWLWQDWVPFGFLTLLVGEPGCGKSLVALDGVRIVTTPDRWPLMETGPMSASLACWVETESSQQLLNIRSKSMGIQRNRILLPGFHDDLLGQPDMMLKEDQERLTNLVHYNKPALVVVDSLGGAHTRGENKIEEVRPMLSFLADLARDEGVAILAVHHVRKRSGNDDFEITTDRVRGSSGFNAFARSILALEVNPGGRDATLRCIKANLTVKPTPIIVTIHSDKHRNPQKLEYSKWQAPEPKKTKKQRVADWVWDYLSANGKTNFGDLVKIAGEHGYTRGILYDARDVLGDSLEVTGDGRSSYWNVMVNPLNGAAEE